jgi:ABC-type glycerol-3-phosphate transport system permease component
MKNKQKKKISQFFQISMLMLVIFGAVFPFFWMISSSFKTNSEIFTYPPVWIPREPTTQSYRDLFTKPMYGETKFIDFAKNSLFVSLTTAIITVVMAALGSYGMSRFKFKGSKALKYLILLSQMLPGALLLIPLYMIMVRFDLINNHWSLILAYISFTLPYCTYLLKSYIDSIPESLDEAALVDGCNRVQALIKIVFPVAAPGIVVTFVQAFIMGWNEYMFALAFMNRNSQWTIPVALGSFRGQYIVNWGYLFAGSVLLTLPVLLLFLFFQRWLVTGLSAGAVKG